MAIRPDRGQSRATHVREMPEPDPEHATLRALGVGDPGRPLGVAVAGEPRTSVVVQSAAREWLLGHDFDRRWSRGKSSSATGWPTPIIPVATCLASPGRPAESTGASLLRFTFTGESFLSLGDLLARRGRDEQVLGWYHTHLFAATRTRAVQGRRPAAHVSFRRPWQEPALVNLGFRAGSCAGTGRQPRPAGDDRAPYWLAAPGRAGRRTGRRADGGAVSAGRAVLSPGSGR